MVDAEELPYDDEMVHHAQEFQGWRAFWAERVEEDTIANWRQTHAASKARRMEKRGKLVIYPKASEDIRKGLDVSRDAEWQK